MFEAITNAVGTAKEKIIQASAKAFLNGKIAEFGTITSLSLDPRARTASITADLKGETTLIQIDVEAFELLELDGEPHVRVLSVATSREWLTCALRQYVVGRSLKIPRGAASLLQ